MKFLYNFFKKKNYAKRVNFMKFSWVIYCADFFLEKIIKK
jgi:hypothetical protein